MNRDMDLIPRILLEVEELKSGQRFQQRVSSDHPDGTDPNVYDEHVAILFEGGYLEGLRVTAQQDMVDQFLIDGLTWGGREFLDSIRDPGVWAKIKAKAAEEGGNLPLEVMKHLGTAYLQKKLGLDDEEPFGDGSARWQR
jgi:hypothetical protein